MILHKIILAETVDVGSRKTKNLPGCEETNYSTRCQET